MTESLTCTSQCGARHRTTTLLCSTTTVSTGLLRRDSTAASLRMKSSRSSTTSRISSAVARDREFMYVLKWIQGLLTTGRANGVILLLVGLEGAGKGFLYKMLSKFIIGEEYCTTINDINKFVKGEFNSQIENKILVLFDEMAAPSEKEQKMVFDVIKNMTTDDQIVINEKYVKKYIVLNMNNFMVATNNNDAVALTKTGRRTFVNRVSNKHRNKKQFFKPLSDFVEQNADAVLTYLLDLDLDHIELADFPRNEDRNAMVEASMDPASALIEDIIEYGGFPKGLMGKGRVETLQEMEVRELYEMFCEYVHSRFPGRTPKSMKWFGIAMTNAVHPDENGPLFEKADKRIEGRVCRIYVYKGPQLLDAMDES
ncbi:hypothetical protein AMAG_09473 [Allomyces macrogynus ATCC 38327]|uniref:NrS-1 polymerase-like helicase domain-containing protein n=1 Tax=Allomyces macrogynus (strain ATCC 38327) TaxID=578462 RepID=A0A0L0SPN1_ALLM3|nr:hypothetical protein AMAG_09473 [Allomyces macrogynus ATCC 38327]|eukprot:KNE64453.1 hypothetical protein AMAG_09473 [Allomyces macrogynus ATCC 38327]